MITNLLIKVEKPGMELDPNMILQILRPSTNIVVWQNPLKEKKTKLSLKSLDALFLFKLSLFWTDYIG